MQQIDSGGDDHHLLRGGIGSRLRRTGVEKIRSQAGRQQRQDTGPICPANVDRLVFIYSFVLLMPLLLCLAIEFVAW